MRPSSKKMQGIPINVVGSSIFGRYPKISIEETFNMIISDDWLVPYAGHTLVITISPKGIGRGIFTSTRSGNMIAIIDNGVYLINDSLFPSQVGTVSTFTGDVFIAENQKNEIAICDKKNLFIFNYVKSTFTQVPNLDFVPGYVAYQDGRFIASSVGLPQWRLCDPANSLSWPDSPNFVGSFQTKGDNVVATVPLPGKGNAILIFGNIVTEIWYDIGLQLFPYQKSTSYNIDYGCLNSATIGYLDDIVCWLGGNEQSGPVIMYTTGGDIKQISTDGINFLLSSLTDPQNSYGFMVKQDGHMLYQLTFPNDEISVVYDFNTQKFFTVSDENQGAHIAKKMVFFNGDYFFISIVDGNIYQFSSTIYDYNGHEIPRIRVCQNIRLPNSSRFIINSLELTIEQNQTTNLQRVDLTVSKDGGYTFGNSMPKYMNQMKTRQNRLIFWNLGISNDFVPQFRFWADARFVLSNGMASVYQ